MKKFVLMAIVASTSATIAKANQQATFSKLNCYSAIMDKVSVSASAQSLTFRWEPRGNPKFLPLLRQLADPAIPVNLLRAYDYAEISLTVPLESCDFTGRPAIGFVCRYVPSAAIPFVLKAKLSPYESDETADYYRGSLAAIDLTSTYADLGSSPNLQFNVGMRMVDSAETLQLQGHKYIVYDYEFEGSPAYPMCDADGEYIRPMQ